MSENEVTQFVDYYKLFDIEPQAPLETIRARYIRLAKLAHPDVGGSTSAMQQLNRAYRTLANATSRAAYDMLHSLHTGHGGQPTYQYTEAPGTQQQGSDDYVDMFIDQVYQEFTSAKLRRVRSSTGFLSKLRGFTKR